MKFCPSLSSFRLGAGLWLAALTGLADVAHAGTNLTEAWNTLSTGFYDDAIRQFTASGNSRAAQLGTAIAQCNRPPVTASSLAEAQRQLEELAAANDEIGRAAQYFLARLWQWHPMTPDTAAAARLYERLVATGADDHWCRLALVKLAILRLTALGAANGLPARLTSTEQLLTRTADPVTQRDLHLVIAEVRLHHELYDAPTFAHLQAALGDRTLPADLRADLLVQTGRIAVKLGDATTARAHFEIFLREFPKDRRHFEVQQALLQLGPLPSP